MSDRDVYLDDMGFLIDTAALDRVLEGRAQADDAWIEGFVDDMRAAFPTAPIGESLEESHVAAIVASVRETVPVPAVAPVSRLERLRSSIATRVGALTLAVGSGLTGAAYAGVLPDPLQGAVSDRAADIGFDLPHPDDDLALDVNEEPVEDPAPGGGGDPKQERSAREDVGDSEGAGSGKRSTSGGRVGAAQSEDGDEEERDASRSEDEIDAEAGEDEPASSGEAEDDGDDDGDEPDSEESDFDGDHGDDRGPTVEDTDDTDDSDDGDDPETDSSDNDDDDVTEEDSDGGIDVDGSAEDPADEVEEDSSDLED